MRSVGANLFTKLVESISRCYVETPIEIALLQRRVGCADTEALDLQKALTGRLFLLVFDEKLAGGQPLQGETQTQIVEHQALEFAGQ